jgi:hypothetical protein
MVAERVRQPHHITVIVGGHLESIPSVVYSYPNRQSQTAIVPNTLPCAREAYFRIYSSHRSDMGLYPLYFT